MNLTELVGATRCLMIDFDGPVCAVFAGYPAATVANELCAVIRSRFGAELPLNLDEHHADPLRMLVEVASLGDDELTREVAAACRDAEITATGTATPTPGTEDVLRAAQAAGYRTAIVSNNATEAIDAYLRRHNLFRYVSVVVARFDGMDPRLLKPNPFLLDRAVAALEGQSDEATFIGDSVSDVVAGRAAGVRTIGYANKPGKRDRLTDAGADIVIESMQDLAVNLRHAAANPTR
ncbi:HAD family hydrolase [Actinoplanes solisilvae]|uniref:HAD family hydrolase n=1 Tax=Actinoplanes solisilvae TaxID=2486853 RepID=UPI000FD9E681|nr:HAD-IA family hydrolase [Actinoplanes solisilvae]